MGNNLDMVLQALARKQRVAFVFIVTNMLLSISLLFFITPKYDVFNIPPKDDAPIAYLNASITANQNHLTILSKETEFSGKYILRMGDFSEVIEITDYTCRPIRSNKYEGLCDVKVNRSNGGAFLRGSTITTW